MSTPKGWSSQEKDEELEPQFSTVQPVGPKTYGLDVNAHAFYEEIATDAAEAGCTTTNIVATSHSAQIGDIIRMTSGSLSGQEAVVVERSDQALDANNIPLGEAFSSAPSNTDTFTIYRNRKPVVSAAGGLAVSLSDPIRFDLNGTTTDVSKDTGTPSNSNPLPVEILSASGVEINVTTGDIGVQLTHSGGSPDSVLIGDGTETVNVNASNEMQVADDTARTSLATIAGDTTSLDGKMPAQGAALTAASVPVNIASDQTVPVSAASLPLPTGAATAANQTTANSALAAIQTAVEILDNAISGTEMQVDVVTSALPTGAATSANQATANSALAAIQTAVELLDNTVSGTELQVDVVTSALPTGAATAANQTTANSALSAIQTAVELIDNAISGTEMQVDVVTSALPTGAATAANQASILSELDLDVVDLIDDKGDGAGIVFAANDNIDDSAGTYLEIVGSLAADCKAIQVLDTTGGYIGLYTGAAASEALKAVIGPGSDQTLPCRISSGTRISVRRMDSATTPLTAGFLAINFLG